MPNRIIIASNNSHKLTELSRMLAPIDSHWKLASLSEATTSSSPSWIENGSTFLENARIKARHVFETRKNQRDYVLADDSGLCVAVLGGRPGVRSARYAGVDADDDKNNLKLLEELRGVPVNSREATFVCALVLLAPDGSETAFRGECRGVILDELHGKNGFGYDPLFCIPELAKTFADLEPEEKGEISHRSIAVNLLMAHLKSIDT